MGVVQGIAVNEDAVNRDACGCMWVHAGAVLAGLEGYCTPDYTLSEDDPVGALVHGMHEEVHESG